MVVQQAQIGRFIQRIVCYTSTKQASGMGREERLIQSKKEHSICECSKIKCFGENKLFRRRKGVKSTQLHEERKEEGSYHESCFFIIRSTDICNILSELGKLGERAQTSVL